MTKAYYLMRMYKVEKMRLGILRHLLLLEILVFNWSERNKKERRR